MRLLLFRALKVTTISQIKDAIEKINRIDKNKTFSTVCGNITCHHSHTYMHFLSHFVTYSLSPTHTCPYTHTHIHTHTHTYRHTYIHTHVPILIHTISHLHMLPNLISFNFKSSTVHSLLSTHNHIYIYIYNSSISTSTFASTSSQINTMIHIC